SVVMITTEDLREGVARFVLGRGVRVDGAVVDQEGEPIREGLVVWHDDPYHHAGADETRLDEAGRFRSVPLPEGERTFTVVAPGFEPQTRKLELKAEMDEVLFELNPGKRLALRLVAAGGEPVPNATVSIARWRGANALYNHRHPNVPDSEVPRKTDKQGLFLWSWAPADAVTYRIWAKGYASQQVTLVATEAEHTVTLAAKLEASGKVTKPGAQAGSIE
ncbi:MAG: carboxypeptidase-like regulatory domain-containing protein, partial [Acidobacteriota bacterium]